MTFVIVGASLAGVTAAETLRAEGFDGRVVLIGEETELPYERPPLSKGYLLGTAGTDKVYRHDRPWYTDHDIELRLGEAATGLDPGNHRVELTTGQHIGYDKLLLATGSSPRRLTLPGADLDGVFYLRTLADSTRLRDALSDGGHVVVAGAGWIGLETAAAAHSHGCHVTIIDPGQAPLLRVLGPELGGFFADLHRAKGVQLRFGEQFSQILGEEGKVRAVVTSSGQQIPADAVIIGVGVTPNTRLAETAGLMVDNGIVLDSSLRSSDPDIYAAGDVANADHPLLGRRIRVEHWANALNQGPVAARAMLGQQIVYDRVPYFFTDQYELGMEYTGYVPPGGHDELVIRGDLHKGEFIAFWLKDHIVLAGMNVNIWDVTDPIKTLVTSRRPVDTIKLADPNTALEDLPTG